LYVFYDVILLNKTLASMMKMMRTGVLAFMLAVMAFGTAHAGWDPAERDHARVAVEYFRKNAPALDRFFEKAYGYVVFPDVFKGGFMMLGGGHGNGYVYELNNLIGHSTITQINVGPQLGGQSFSEIIFFKDKEELDNFKQGNYELNAQVEGIVANTGAATTIDFSHGVAVFVLPKAGIMAEATVGGQKFSYREY